MTDLVVDPLKLNLPPKRRKKHENRRQVSVGKDCKVNCHAQKAPTIPSTSKSISCDDIHGESGDNMNQPDKQKKRSSHRSAPRKVSGIKHSQVTQKARQSHKSSHHCLSKHVNIHSMFRQQRAQEKEIGNKNEEQVASADSCGADCSENSQSEVPRPGAFISASSGAVDELANHLNTKRKQSSHRSAPKNCPSIGHSQVTRKGQKIHKSSHQRLGKDENFDSKFRQQKVQEHKIGNKNEEESASTDSWCGEFPQDGQLEGLRLGGLTSASSGACEEIIDRLDTPKKQPSHQSAPRKAAGIGRSRVTQKGRQRHESSHHSLGKDDALDYTFRQRRAQEERIGNKNEEEGASMDSWDGNCSQDGHSEVPHPGAFRSTLSDAVEEMIDEQPNWHSMLSSSNNDDGKTLLLEATLVEEADLIVSSILVTAIPDQRGEEDFSSSHTEATKHGYRRRRQVCILLGVVATLILIIFLVF